MNIESTSARGAQAFGLDSKLFLGAILMGFALMVLLKSTVSSQLFVTIPVASVIVAYSIVVYRYPRLHIRLDQAGDNAYYLGLIFTLMSMAWALYAVGQQISTAQVEGHFSAAESVIGDFGLALATTLVGIICRIVLHQMRIDPADVEKASRIELAKASQNLREKMRDISSEMGRFYEQLRQQQEDHSRNLHEGYQSALSGVLERLDQSSDMSVKAMQAASNQMNSSIQQLAESAQQGAEAFDTASQRLLAIEPPPTKLSRSFGTMATKVDQITESLSSAAESISSSAGQFELMSGAMSKSVQSLAAVVPLVQATLGEQQTEFSASTRRFNLAATDLSEAVTTLKADIVGLGDEIGAVTNAAAVAENAATKVVEGLTLVVEKVNTSLGAKVQP